MVFCENVLRTAYAELMLMLRLQHTKYAMKVTDQWNEVELVEKVEIDDVFRLSVEAGILGKMYTALSRWRVMLEQN